MLDNLINLVKEHAGDAIINNKAIPNEHNDAAISSTANSIFDTLKSQVAGGNLSSITDMFSNNGNSALSSNISSNVAGDLMKKFGLDNTQAAGIASSLIPTVMQSLAKKTNDPNDSSFDMQGILSSLGGGGGLGGMLGGLTNLFK
ncbi:MAG: hypothetical protein IT236_06445 [Bacteroidia bacterium]|nr:hypothetical protein [Bacteroidia bacterium]